MKDFKMCLMDGCAGRLVLWESIHSLLLRCATLRLDFRCWGRARPAVGSCTPAKQLNVCFQAVRELLEPPASAAETAASLPVSKKGHREKDSLVLASHIWYGIFV